jgi:hypothetical protein
MHASDKQFDTGPASFALAVVLERRELKGNRWASCTWDIVGVAAGAAVAQGDGPMLVATDESGTEHYLWPGFKVSLFADEAESYYHNLMAEKASCYVVVREAESGERPQPFLVTLSFDEAHAYLEGDDSVHAVPMPPELYRWAEAFVLAHYVPEQRKKRKRQNWKDQGERR